MTWYKDPIVWVGLAVIAFEAVMAWLGLFS